MPNNFKSSFLEGVEQRIGRLSKIGDSLSLYRAAGSDIRIYIRYSKIHGENKTWYGLREVDLRNLEGYPSFLCFLWDNQKEPLIVPFSDYEEIFQSVPPADDGQYKVQVLFQEDGTELYIARAGKFNVEGYLGWSQLDIAAESSGPGIPSFSHSQIQTLLGSIGAKKDYDIWIPSVDRPKLDWNITKEFPTKDALPHGYDQVANILGEIDVMWLSRGRNEIKALFEVEHSTPIYSGLLRLNDIHLAAPAIRTRFSIVANEERRSLFVKQLNRPTFSISGLDNLCTFLEYRDVYNWHSRLS